MEETLVVVRATAEIAETLVVVAATADVAETTVVAAAIAPEPTATADIVAVVGATTPSVVAVAAVTWNHALYYILELDTLLNPVAFRPHNNFTKTTTTLLQLQRLNVSLSNQH